LISIASSHQILTQWFNTSGFVTNPSQAPAEFQVRTFPFYIGNVRGPKLILLNTSLHRDFHLYESMVLQFRADAINVLNPDQFADPVTTPTSAQFGQITGPGGTVNRFVTFVAKLVF